MSGQHNPGWHGMAFGLDYDCNGCKIRYLSTRRGAGRQVAFVAMVL